MKKNNNIAGWLSSIFNGIFDTLRSPLGYRYMCCIFPESCSEYAKRLIKDKPLYISIPKIIFRVLSCNPINGLLKRFTNLR